MNKKYILASLTGLIFALSGCQSLDTDPSGSIATEDQKAETQQLDPEKAEAGVNGIFAQFSQKFPNESALGGVDRHNDIGYPSVMMFTDMNGNDVISKDNGYNWAGKDLAYTDRIYTSYECQIVWNDMYSIIRTCNSLLSTLTEDSDDSQTQFYYGQAVATRAFCYWVLAQLYQFNYVGNESEACVPIVTQDNSDQVAISGVKRSTVKQVYDFMLSDIDQAISLLKSAQDNGTTRSDKRYISLAVAYGLRARINLTMENWSSAATDAESAIATSSASPASISDVSTPYFWDASEGDWMWGIIIATTDAVAQSGIVNWISHMGSLNYGYANYSGGRQINKALYATIPSSDVRKGWWLDADSTSTNLSTEQAAFMKKYSYPAYTQVKFAPYENVIDQTVNANDIPLMRIEEMYLIKAEGETMSGNTSEGKSTLEEFVQTYRDPEYVCDASDQDGIQEEIFRQRRIELWGEGLNWFDLMRLNKGVDRRGAGYPNSNMVFDIDPGSAILLWRIPEAEIQANDSLSNADNNPSASVPSPVTDTE